jgi:hypothetical protein
VSVAWDNGLAVDALAMNIDCVFSRKNISPPASNGEIGVVMTGILRSIP